MVRVFLGNVQQMLIPNSQQFFLSVFSRMLNVYALFMLSTAAHDEFNSSHGRRLDAAGND